MKWIAENWSMLVICLITLSVAGYGAYTKRANAKEWLKWAVLQAEKALGEKTGQAKLRMVYDLFTKQFPWFATFVSFNTFSEWVDEALTWMRKQINTNSKVSEIVKEAEK